MHTVLSPCCWISSAEVPVVSMSMMAVEAMEDELAKQWALLGYNH